jgi:hypothetical protein
MSNVENLLGEKYDEYLELIDSLCSSYDTSQKEVISLSISTAIRVLVHDTDRSISLLTHLRKKDIPFVSTNYLNEKEKVHLGLVRRINVGVKDGTGGDAKYWPLCDERYFQSPKVKRFIPFEEWWDIENIFDSGNSSLTRKDLVLSVANKDGGAHFDTKVQKKYDDFRHKWSGGSTLVGIKSGIRRGYDNIPVYPAIRQIGYEILCTLRP